MVPFKLFTFRGGWLKRPCIAVAVGLVFTVVAGLFNAVSAQSRVDSVLTLLKGKPDTVVIKYLNEICWVNRSSNPQWGVDCGEKALEICLRIGNKTLAARAYNLLGISYRSLGYYDKSIAFLHNALAVAEETNNYVEVGFAENNISGAYRMKGYYSAAMQHVLRGMSFFEKAKFKSGIAYCMINLGFISGDQHDFQKSIGYFQQACTIRREIGDTLGEAIALCEMGKAYVLVNNFPVAMEKFKEAEQIYTSKNDRGGLMSISTGMGDVYLKLKRYGDALRLYQQYYQMARDARIVRNVIIGANRLGIVYTKLHKFEEAEHYLKETERMNETAQDYALTMDNYLAFSDMYTAEGNTEEALKYARMYIALKDSVLSRENISGVKEMEAAYESEKAKTENALLLKDVEFSRSQRNLWVIITILLICATLLISWKYIYQKQTEEKIRKINSELQALNATRDKFFSIIAHDLRSPFQMMLGISELLYTDIESLPPKQVKKFSKELHQGIRKQFELLNDLLEWSRLQRGDIPIEKKILLLQTEIQGVIDGFLVPSQVKEITLTTDVPGNLEVLADSNMLRLVLRNLISNSLKFTNPKGEIRVVAGNESPFVRISVYDDGVGISDTDVGKLFRGDARFSTPGTANEKGTGLGLILCREIIEKHGGTINVESAAGKGSCFSFTLLSAEG